MEFQLSYFQIQKDDAVKVLHSICQQTWKTQQWPQDWKRSVFIPVPKKGSAKECSNYLTVALISHTSKIILKILQARLQQYVNHELPDVQVGFRKGRGTRDQIANIHWIIKKQESSRKTSISALLTMPKPLTVWITTNCGKFLNRWECKATLPASWEICMQVRKTVRTGHGTTDWFQMGKGVKAVYCHPAYLTYMQSTSNKKASLCGDIKDQWDLVCWARETQTKRLHNPVCLNQHMYPKNGKLVSVYGCVCVCSPEKIGKGVGSECGSEKCAVGGVRNSGHSWAGLDVEQPCVVGDNGRQMLKNFKSSFRNNIGL